MENFNLKLGFIKRDRAITRSILISTSFVYAVLITFFNIYFLNKNIIGSETGVYFVGLLAFSIGALAVYLGWYMNSIAMVSRNREFAIQLTAGLSKPRAFGLAAFQSFFIVGVSIFFGVIATFLLTPVLTTLLNSLTNLKFVTFGFSLQGFGLALLMISLQTFVMIMNNGGLFYRAETIDIINLHKKETISDTKKKPLLALISVLATFSIFIGYFYASKYKAGIDLIRVVDSLATTSIFGLVGLKLFAFPYLIDFLCKKKFLNKKMQLLTLKELSFSIKQSLALLILILIIPQLSVLSFNGVGISPEASTLTRVALVLFSLIVTMTITFKLTLEGLKRIDAYKTLKLLGFSNSEVLKIVKDKMILFTIYILVLPLSLGFVSTHLYSIGGALDMTFIVPFFGLTLILGIVAIFISHKILKNNILENLN